MIDILRVGTAEFSTQPKTDIWDYSFGDGNRKTERILPALKTSLCQMSVWLTSYAVFWGEVDSVASNLK